MRYAILYFAHFFAYGCYGPYLSLYLGRTLGYGQTEIGWILAIFGLTGLAGPFLWGPLAERTSRRRAMFVVGFALSAVIYPVYIVTGSVTSALIPTVLLGAVFMPIIPLIDDITMRHVREAGADYGHIRLWGSLSFIAASLTVGWAMEAHEWVQFPVFALAEIIGLVVILTFPASALNYRAAETKDLHFWRAMSGSFVIFLIAAFIGRLANVGHYVFFSLYLESIGVADSIKGVAWSVGVVAEIAMMIVAGRFIGRFGARVLFTIGLVGSAIRFLVYVYQPTVEGALVGQLFHAFSFGALHIGSVTLVSQLAPEGRTGTGQMAHAALCIGVGTTVGSTLAGYMADAWGYHGMYLCSSGLAILAALVFVPLLLQRTAAPVTESGT